MTNNYANYDTEWNQINQYNTFYVYVLKFKLCSPFSQIKILIENDAARPISKFHILSENKMWGVLNIFTIASQAQKSLKWNDAR